jgi:GTP cyclohydrolase I
MKQLKTHIKTDQEKIEQIEYYFEKILQVLEVDLNNDNFKETPHRVAKMYVKEAFSGLNPVNFPSVTTFKNSYEYDQMLLSKDITLYSYCAHHFVPIIGKAHVAYFPNERVIGLSKINRIVHHLSKRPQVQEKLTKDIATALGEVLDTTDVAVLIEAEHLCVSSRGINDTNNTTRTSHFGGKFKSDSIKKEFLAALKST